MNKHLSFIWLLGWMVFCLTACSKDSVSAGGAVLDEDDAIVVLADTFPISSTIDTCDAIISQADSFLLGEIETDYGTLRASILTQLACPEGYTYPNGAGVDSICLFMYYSSWVGDGKSPLAVDAYLMDKKTFSYSGTYPTDINIDDYCSRDKSILANHRIVVASEKLDSVKNSNGAYVPMLRVKLNDDFMNEFWSIQSFESQEAFNQKFKGLFIETSFGSSTILNISDVALGVYYHFSYSKAGRDTTVNDMKAFYANSEVRTVNHLSYLDKSEWVETLRKDSNTYNYVVSPAGIYTRLTFPMEQITDSIVSNMIIVTQEENIYLKRPYVNLVEVRVMVENVYEGTESQKGHNDWLQPAAYMLLVKENSMERFFKNKEVPSDTCALLSALITDVDSIGNSIYYYSYDMSDFLTNQLRQDSLPSELKMMLVPVSVTTSTSSSTSSTSVTSVQQQQTLSATKIKSASNGMNLKMVYSGF